MAVTSFALDPNLPLDPFSLEEVPRPS